MFKAGDKVKFKREPRNFHGQVYSEFTTSSLAEQVDWRRLELTLTEKVYLGMSNDFESWDVEEGNGWGWVRSDDIELVE